MLWLSFQLILLFFLWFTRLFSFYRASSFGFLVLFWSVLTEEKRKKSILFLERRFFFFCFAVSPFYFVISPGTFFFPLRLVLSHSIFSGWKKMKTNKFPSLSLMAGFLLYLFDCLRLATLFLVPLFPPFPLRHGLPARPHATVTVASSGLPSHFVLLIFFLQKAAEGNGGRSCLEWCLGLSGLLTCGLPLPSIQMLSFTTLATINRKNPSTFLAVVDSSPRNQ